MFLLWIFFVICVCLCHTVIFVSCNLVVTCCERAYPLAFMYVMFSCAFLSVSDYVSLARCDILLYWFINLPSSLLCLYVTEVNFISILFNHFRWCSAYCISVWRISHKINVPFNLFAFSKAWPSFDSLGILHMKELVKLTLAYDVSLKKRCSFIFQSLCT